MINCYEAQKSRSEPEEAPILKGELSMNSVDPELSLGTRMDHLRSSYRTLKLLSRTPSAKVPDPWPVLDLAEWMFC